MQTLAHLQIFHKVTTLQRWYTTLQPTTAFSCHFIRQYFIKWLRPVAGGILRNYLAPFTNFVDEETDLRLILRTPLNFSFMQIWSAPYKFNSYISLIIAAGFILKKFCIIKNACDFWDPSVTPKFSKTQKTESFHQSERWCIIASWDATLQNIWLSPRWHHHHSAKQEHL